jgi:hypothetical protein
VVISACKKVVVSRNLGHNMHTTVVAKEHVPDF